MLHQLHHLRIHYRAYVLSICTHVQHVSKYRVAKQRIRISTMLLTSVSTAARESTRMKPVVHTQWPTV
jgi:hypothetical protein